MKFGIMKWDNNDYELNNNEVWDYVIKHYYDEVLYGVIEFFTIAFVERSDKRVKKCHEFNLFKVCNVYIYFVHSYYIFNIYTYIYIYICLGWWFIYDSIYIK